MTQLTITAVAPGTPHVPATSKVWLLKSMDPCSKRCDEAVVVQDVFASKQAALDFVYDSEVEERVENGDGEHEAGELAAQVRKDLDNHGACDPDMTVDGMMWVLDEMTLWGSRG